MDLNKLGCILGLLGSSALVYGDQKIKHVVVLMEENRPFDHLFGWRKGVNGLAGTEFNLLDPSDPSSQKIFVNSTCPYINVCDPGHGTSATTFKLYTSSDSSTSPPNMGGFVNYEASHTDYCDVMNGFSPDRLPVINSLADEFAVMDRFFASHPGPTWPNRMFTLSGTSAGSTETFAWYHNEPGRLFPQQTIFDQLENEGRTWKNYYNDTPWELFLEKIADSPDNMQPMEVFYADAKAGTLPSFSWINPRSGINITTGIGSNDQHPDHDMNAGEQYYKDIYEALRSSPAWKDTLFVITYDEHGGFYDHVPPPSYGVPPPGDGEQSYPGEGFKFDRLGVRIPTLLISPWIPKGTVISAPPDVSKPTDTSEFDLTSIIASTRKLLGMKAGPLTDRDGWSATFDFVVDLLETPRDDCPLHLPDAIPPSPAALQKEANLPLNDLQKHIGEVHSRLVGAVHNPLISQSEHSEIMMGHLGKHTALTSHFKRFSSDNYQIQTKSTALYTGNGDDYAWDLNGLIYGGKSDYANNTKPFITLSTMHLRVNIDTPAGEVISQALCLDGGDGQIGSELQVSPCFPSPDPMYNRAPMQHFVLHSDGSLRLYNPLETSFNREALCVTNHHPHKETTTTPSDNASYRTTLEICVPINGDSQPGRVEQSWSYHGGAPGVGRGGQLFYGDWGNALGVVQL